MEQNYKTFDQTFQLKEVDSLEIISLIDNSVDFLSTIDRGEVRQVRGWVKERKGKEWFEEQFSTPMAEHGFSMLIRVFCDGNSHKILFDTGGSSRGVVTNIERMGLSLSEIEAIILSHGHYDHFGGLLTVLGAANKTDLPIIVHEDMFSKRGVSEVDGTIRRYPDFPTDEQVKPAKFVRTKQPYPSADGTVLVTGQIPRETDFEKGYTQHRVFIEGKWQPDPYIWDDRAIIINVKHKGLVVISGCAHAGIVNTTQYAQHITGVNNVLAIIGGFHLAGKECEQRISQTVRELKQIDPTIMVPTHCTGWRAFYAIREAMPKASIWNSVGNLYQFSSSL